MPAVQQESSLERDVNFSDVRMPAANDAPATEPERKVEPERVPATDPFTPPSEPSGPGRAPSKRPDRTVPSHPEPAPKIEPTRRPRHC